jgi:hypothetical protein
VKPGEDKLKKFIFASVIILSCLLRVYSLGRQSYWIDEMVSIHFAHHPAWQAIFWDNNPFPYFLILKFWMALFGTAEAATRSLSVIFSVATTAVLFSFGLETAGLAAGTTMALIQATLVTSVQYAQETRMYAFFEFAAAVNMFFFFRLWLRGQHRRGYVLSSIFITASHYLSVVPLALQAPLILFSSRLNRRQKVFLWSGVTLGGILLAISYFAFFNWPYLEWQKYKFSAEPESHLPVRILWSFTNKNVFSMVGVSVLLALTPVISKISPERRRLLLTLLYFTILPVVIFEGAALITHRGIFLPRYFIFVVPYFSAWIALALMTLWERKRLFFRAATVLITALLTAGATVSIPKAYLQIKSPWRDAARIVSQYPNSYGLTSRTKSLQSPYFDDIHVNIDKLDFKTPPSTIIKDKLEIFDNVWIIENYYGGTQYLEPLKNKMESLGFKTEKYSVATELSEPVLMLRVYRALQ